MRFSCGGMFEGAETTNALNARAWHIFVIVLFSQSLFIWQGRAEYDSIYGMICICDYYYIIHKRLGKCSSIFVFINRW